MEFEEFIEQISEKFKKANNNFDVLSKIEQDILSFAITYEMLLMSLNENLSVSDEIKCKGKMTWLKSSLSAKYPQFKEQIQNYKNEY